MRTLIDINSPNHIAPAFRRGIRRRTPDPAASTFALRASADKKAPGHMGHGGRKGHRGTEMTSRVPRSVSRINAPPSA